MLCNVLKLYALRRKLRCKPSRICVRSCDYSGKRLCLEGTVADLFLNYVAQDAQVAQAVYYSEWKTRKKQMLEAVAPKRRVRG